VICFGSRNRKIKRVQNAKKYQKRNKTEIKLLTFFFLFDILKVNQIDDF
jgi:hypothetical protein